MSKLVLKNASAGAGKTTSLTRAFIDLCLSNPNDPLFFRRILEITFTNKAAEQLREKIFAKLWASYKDRSSLNEDERHWDSQAASSLLRTMLFHYDALSIHTIDSFYHQSVEELLREMMFSHTQHITLRTQDALSESVSLLMDEENLRKEQPIVFKWLCDAMYARIEEGAQWNIKGNLVRLGAELFSEAYKRLGVEPSGDFQAIARLRDRFGELLSSLEEELKSVASSALERIRHFQLDPAESFRGRSRALSLLFVRIVEGTAVRGLWSRRRNSPYAEISNWCTKESGQPVVECVQGGGGLMECYGQCMRLLATHYAVFALRERLREWALLGEIARQLRQYRQRHDTLFVSDFTDILLKVHPEVLPTYLYERLGTTYEHYFVDECQDTSLSQWGVIKPLIANSLANGKKSVLIGDSKQSIYSFRGADSLQLLKDIEQNFSHVLEKETLPTNYRSASCIVRFNNALFPILAGQLAESFSESPFADIYQSVRQEPCRTKQGKVMVKGARGVGDSEVFRWLDEAIAQLCSAGFAPRDIAILTRSKRDMDRLAAHLSAAGHRFVSEESFLFSSSSVLRFLMHACRYLYFADSFFLACMQHELRSSEPEVPAADHSVFSDIKKNAPGPFGVFQGKKASLKGLGLCDLLSQLVAIFSLETRSFCEEASFLRAFFDEAQVFAQRHGHSLGDFIAWWDQEGKDKKIVPSDTQRDALRLFTIHKSKGLEFEAVLLPYCNWDLSKHEGFLWCDIRALQGVSSAVGTEVTHLPASYREELEQTPLFSFYEEKKKRDYLENLNTLYVACTRAKEALGVFCPLKREESSGNEDIGDHLRSALTKLKGFEESGGTFSYEQGTLSPEEKENDKDSFVPYGAYACWDTTNFLRARQERLPSDGPRQVGTYFHDLLRGLYDSTKSDVYCHAFCLRRHLPSSLEAELQTKLQKLFSQERVRGWFSSRYEVRSEMRILSQGHVYRPDRVLIQGRQAIVIDFKTGKAQKEYEEKVRDYMHMLLDMHYQPVEGWLLYVDDAALQPVHLS